MSPRIIGYICKNNEAPKNEFTLAVKVITELNGDEIFIVPNGRNIRVSFITDDVLINGKEARDGDVLLNEKESAVFSVYCIAKPDIDAGNIIVNFWSGATYAGGLELNFGF
jgi:hypothetical protein